MALDDFSISSTPPTTPTPARAPEDEDLFDFPVLEVTLESMQLEEAKSSSSAPTPFLVPASPKPAAAPAKPVAAPTPIASTPAPRTPPTPHVAPLANAASAHAPQTHAAPVTPPASAPTAAARKTPPDETVAAHAHAATARTHVEDDAAIEDVESAAALIDDIETAMGDDLEAGLTKRSAARTKRARAPLSTAWLVIGVGLVLNAGAFFLLWQSNRSFRHGIEGMRDELIVMVREMRLGASETRAALPAVHDPVGHAPVQREPSATVDATKLASAPPIEPFEKTTLTLAEDEIRTGEYASARRRLHRLLAMADRIDEALRAHVETRASYLLADSYRLQAQARRGSAQ